MESYNNINIEFVKHEQRKYGLRLILIIVSIFISLPLAVNSIRSFMYLNSAKTYKGRILKKIPEHQNSINMILIDIPGVGIREVTAPNKIYYLNKENDIVSIQLTNLQMQERNTSFRLWEIINFLFLTGTICMLSYNFRHLKYTSTHIKIHKNDEQ